MLTSQETYDFFLEQQQDRTLFVFLSPTGKGYTYKKPLKVVMAGLEGSGKTTILHKLKIGEHVGTIPTEGYNLE